jgi:PAS domain S-box-containing protein
MDGDRAARPAAGEASAPAIAAGRSEPPAPRGSEEQLRALSDAEQALRESEERYRTLFDSIDDGFCVVEMLCDTSGRAVDYRFLEINPAFPEHTGLKDAVGKTALELVPDLDRWWVETYGRVALTGEPLRFENQAEAMDGRWFEVYAFRFGAPERRQVAIFFKNITVRKRAEARDRYLTYLTDVLRPLTDPAAIQAEVARVLGEHLGASRVHYGDISDDGTYAIVERDYTNGVIGLAGRFRMSDFGPTLIDALRASQTLVVPDVANSEALSEEERAAYAAVAVGAQVVVPLVKDGRLTAVLAVHQRTARVWRVEEVALIEETAERTWAAVERARSEAALRESQERLARIVENIAEGVVTIGPDDRYLSINAAGERILGVDRDQFLGRHNADPPYRRLTLEGEPLGEVPTIAEVAAGGDTVFRHEYLIERADGTRTAIARSITAVRAEDGRFLGAVATFTDITARRQIEETRERLLAAEQVARREAEAANRAKDQFLSVLSHELRTPLTPILGFTQLLQRGQVPADRLRLAIETIDRNARVQARLVEDLLDVSRILSGKLSVEVTSVDPAQMVETAAASARPAAEAKGLTLTVTVAPAVGPVLGDADRLRQVVDNLLANAIKFTPAGGRIDVALEREGEEARITVADTGAGIPAGFLPHIFERFRQADSTTTRAYGGLGLGLAIAQHLVERHGGRIAVESAGEGRGATFRVWLPLAAPEPSRSDAPDEVAGPAPATRLRGVRVLIADDDEDTRTYVRVVLEDEGASVLTAGSSGEALAALTGADVDVLVADIGMPGEDGYALIAGVRALKTTAGDVPAVALTAYAGGEDRRKALEAGFQRHLPKPVESDALVTTVAALAGGGAPR